MIGAKDVIHDEYAPPAQLALEPAPMVSIGMPVYNGAKATTVALWRIWMSTAEPTRPHLPLATQIRGRSHQPAICRRSASFIAFYGRSIRRAASSRHRRCS